MLFRQSSIRHALDSPAQFVFNQVSLDVGDACQYQTASGGYSVFKVVRIIKHATLCVIFLILV